MSCQVEPINVAYQLEKKTIVLLDIWGSFQLICRRAHLPIPSGFN